MKLPKEFRGGPPPTESFKCMRCGHAWKGFPGQQRDCTSCGCRYSWWLNHPLIAMWTAEARAEYEGRLVAQLPV